MCKQEQQLYQTSNQYPKAAICFFVCYMNSRILIKIKKAKYIILSTHVFGGGMCTHIEIEHENEMFTIKSSRHKQDIDLCY